MNVKEKCLSFVSDAESRFVLLYLSIFAILNFALFSKHNIDNPYYSIFFIESSQYIASIFIDSIYT